MDSVPRFTVVRFHGHQPISMYEGTRNQVFIWLLMNPGIVDPDYAVYDRETLVTERVDFFKEMLHEELSKRPPKIDPVIAYTDGVEKIIPIKRDDMENTRQLIFQVIEMTRCHPEKSSEDLFAMFSAQLDGKPEKRDLNHARIDGMKFSVMEEIHALVKQATETGQSNPGRDLSESILGYTSEIVELVSGVSSQTKNQKHFHGMTFRRVKEAIETVIVGGLDYPGDRIINVAEVYAKKIVSDVFGSGMPGIHETESEFVEKYYEMDPETEDLLDNGTLVVDGMKVLIEEPNMRQHISNNLELTSLDNARKMNRWATVLESKIKRKAEGETTLSFVALYDDGIKRKMIVPVRYAWLVKKDSMPRIDMLMNPDNHVIEVFPQAKMVRFLKDRRQQFPMSFDPNGGKVQTGIDGDVIPLKEYMIAEGIMAAEGEGETYYDVVDENGEVEYSDTAAKVVEWFNDKPDKIRQRYMVAKSDHPDAVSAVEFIQEFHAQEGDG